MLPGITASLAGLAASAAVAPSVLYLTSTANNPGGTAVSFASVNIGTASADRVVIVGVFVGKSSGAWSSNPISSFSIGGVSATLAGTQFISGGYVSAIYYASVPTGTTGTISCTMANSANGAVIAVWQANNLTSSTPTATVEAASSASLAISAGGFAVGIASVEATTTFTWTNLTERSDAQFSPYTYSAADSSAAGTSTRTYAPGSGTSQAALAAWA